MHQLDDFIETKRLMQRLWPKWKADDELGKILNERWGQLHQDKLREAMRQHRLVRNVTPDITAIHKAYCKITGITENGYDGRQDAVKTRMQAVTEPTQQELEEWDAWAAQVLSTATEREIAAVKERLGLEPQTDRVLAVAVDHCRRNHVQHRTHA